MIVDSPVTDVIILLINLFHKLPPAITFQTGKGIPKIYIPVQPICESWGTSALGLLGFHAITGNAMSVRFSGRGKDWCFRVFIPCDENILDALGSLGTPADLMQELNLQLDLCVNYASPNHIVPSTTYAVFYSNRAAEGGGLPPTIGSLKPHIQRANYIAMI